MKRKQRLGRYRLMLVGPTVQESKYVKCLDAFEVESIFASSEEKLTRVSGPRKVDGILSSQTPGTRPGILRPNLHGDWASLRSGFVTVGLLLSPTGLRSYYLG